MGQNEPTGRRYNEKQIGALIERATKLHEERTGESEPGLSLPEIERIAAELGVPAEDMRAAALELDSNLNPDGISIENPFSVEQVRVANGEMTEDQWEDLLVDLRRFTGHSGRVSSIGRAREWTHYLGEGSEGVNFTRTQVSVHPKKGKTSIQVRYHYGFARVFYPLGFFLGGLLMLILGENVLSQFALTNAPPFVAFVTTLASAVGGLMVARATVRGWAKKKKERLGVLADRLRQTISVDPDLDVVASPGVELSEAAEPRIDLDSLEFDDQASTSLRKGVKG
ncbi:MAG: hypothetical protein ACI9W4_001869 [Rhodothermales bacterium]|jgi:hypothetical protein